jgi:hypothetical protein
VARNRGQAVRQESGEYDKIVEQHLLKFWQAQENGVTPAAQPAGCDGGAAQGDGSTSVGAGDAAATDDGKPAEAADTEPPAAATTASPGTVRANEGPHDQDVDTASARLVVPLSLGLGD